MSGCQVSSVNSTPHRARFTRAIVLARGSSCSVLGVVSKTIILARMLCFAPALVLHFYHLHSALRPLPLCFSPLNRTNPCAPQSGLLGLFAEQSPLTGHENNAPVEVISTHVSTTLLLSKQTSIGSTYNSGEDIATTPAVSEVDERSDLGMLASPLLMPGDGVALQEKAGYDEEASSDPRRAEQKTPRSVSTAWCH